MPPQKKETPNTQQLPLQNLPVPSPAPPVQQPQKTDIPYTDLDKQSLTEFTKKYVPKQFRPTDRLPKILEFIFLAILILAILQFPLAKFLSGTSDITIKIGYPLVFLELNVQAAQNPLSPLNLILDVIIYFFLAYLIDVLINLVFQTNLVKSKEELKKYPKVFSPKNTKALNSELLPQQAP